MAMIETQQGLAAVEDICALDGLDGIFVGPNDLALALGKAPSNSPTEPEVVAAIDRCVSAARNCGKHAGIFCSSGVDANRRAREGFSFVVPNSEANILKFAIATEVKAARCGLPP
jgi:4-hydroxy-2-oxoheptanedioate aldolase